MSEQVPNRPPQPAAAAVARKRWYIVHAYSGMEKAVERNLRERIDRAGMQDKFGRILVPTEEVVELKNGKKSVTERRIYPGYVLVEMD
jgi:transcriptional antiterminator NusG